MAIAGVKMSMMPTKNLSYIPSLRDKYGNVIYSCVIFFDRLSDYNDMRSTRVGTYDIFL